MTMPDDFALGRPIDTPRVGQAVLMDVPPTLTGAWEVVSNGYIHQLRQGSRVIGTAIAVSDEQLAEVVVAAARHARWGEGATLAPPVVPREWMETEMRGFIYDWLSLDPRPRSDSRYAPTTERVLAWARMFGMSAPAESRAEDADEPGIPAEFVRAPW